MTLKSCVDFLGSENENENENARECIESVCTRLGDLLFKYARRAVERIISRKV
jgi:hypothetical protein